MNELFLVRSVTLFAGMSLDQIEAIRNICVEHHYPKGQTLFKEGELGAHLYLLLSGRIEIVKGAGGPQATSLAVLGSGDHFGELSLLDSQERSATAVVLEDARVLTLEKTRFEQLCLDFPELGLSICRGLSRRLRETDERLAALRFGERSRSGSVSA